MTSSESKRGVFHGGNLGWAEAQFGRPGRGWLDLSTGINPVPYPFKTPTPHAWQALPDASDVARLERAAAACYGIADAGCVVAAPGTQAILQWLPRLRAPTRVAVLAPTYGEHAKTWADAGHDVHLVSDCGQLAQTADVVVVTNPNNPDGRTFPPDWLTDVATSLSARGGWLVVDEAFADVAPDISVGVYVGQPGLVVLRSFGKFFGLAGLRLGFVAAPVALTEVIRRAFGPWPVSGPATEVGTQALSDMAWIKATRRRLTEDAQGLDALLDRAGFTVRGGTSLFRLTENGDAEKIFEHLGRRGILVRHFPDRPGWLRFGLPPQEEFGRLEEGISSFIRPPS